MSCCQSCPTHERLGLLFPLPFAREDYQLIISKYLIPIFLLKISPKNHLESGKKVS